MTGTGQDDGAAALRRLLDRQEILDCLIRYCRGIDRFDRALLLSAYHPDAVNDHGHFSGSPEALADWVFPLLAKKQVSTLHAISNHSCEIDGDVAHAETYYLSTERNHDETVMTAAGRYIDRFERRNGEWRIAARYTISESISAPSPGIAPSAERVNGAPARDRSDPSYRRPLILNGA